MSTAVLELAIPWNGIAKVYHGSRNLSLSIPIYSYQAIDGLHTFLTIHTTYHYGFYYYYFETNLYSINTNGISLVLTVSTLMQNIYQVAPGNLR
jgi:hypothetical protein